GGGAVVGAGWGGGGGWRWEHRARAGSGESPSPGPRPGRRWERAVRRTLRRSAPVRPWGRRRESLLVDLLGHASRLDRASTVRRSRPRPAWPSGDFLRLGVRDGLHTAHPSAVVSTSATVAPRRPLPVLIRPAEGDRANPPMTAPISPTTAATMAPIRPGLMV